ncbi:hypothetical protein BZG36_01166 [Bifiguratus adelaidae]|uniref:Transcription factor domain-containing protein n=1 Tax=Bifiguratus adelaidae TaxID=1938954 RepID=A0A261Y628_9FUNG|nr:hypothetical protein BZG36_01166 [Bifiguratus adelaidae]
MPDDASNSGQCVRCAENDLECMVVKRSYRKVSDSELLRMYQKVDRLIQGMSALDEDLSVLSSGTPFSPTSDLSATVSRLSSEPSSLWSEPHSQADSEAESNLGDVNAPTCTATRQNHTYRQPPTAIVIRAPDGRLLQWTITSADRGLSISTNLQSLQELSEFTSVGWQIYTTSDFSQPDTRTDPTVSPVSSDNVLHVTGGRNIFTGQDCDPYIRNLVSLTDPSSIEHASAQDLEPHRWIPHLLKAYFQLNLPPYIHEASFWQDYHQWKNPMRSAVVMAICAAVVVEQWYLPNTFGDRKFSRTEAKRLCEYYVACAQDLGAEAFDCVSLYALKTFTILLSYYRAMQPVKLSILHAQQALRIGYSVQPDYIGVDKAGKTAAALATIEIAEQEWSRAMSTIYTYLIGLCLCHPTRIKNVISWNELWAHIQETPDIRALPDESDQKRDALMVYNQMGILAKRWFKPDHTMTEHLLMHVLDFSLTASIDFLRTIEQDMLKWYLEMPDDIRLSNSPLQLMTLDDLINKRATYWGLEGFSHFLSLWILVHLRFIPTQISVSDEHLSPQEKIAHDVLDTTMIAATNLLISQIYIFDHLKSDVVVLYLRIVCDVSVAIANIDGLGEHQTKSAKQHVLTAISIVCNHFRRLQINSSPVSLDMPHVDPTKMDNFIEDFVMIPKVAEYIDKDGGYGLKAQEQKMFLGLLREPAIQAVLQSIARDIET